MFVGELAPESVMLLRNGYHLSHAERTLGVSSDEVLELLLTEQFHLYSYTLRQLKTATECQTIDQNTQAFCHIEHILPQCRKVAGEDIDYQSMVAQQQCLMPHAFPQAGFSI